MSYANYQNYTVQELKKICKTNNLKGYSKLRKYELINLLVNEEIILDKKNNLNKKIKYIENKQHDNKEINKLCHCHKEIEEEKKSIFGDCAICFDKIELKDVKISDCNHYFHKDCLKHWTNIKNSCPCCRGNVDPILSMNEIKNKFRDHIQSIDKKLHDQNIMNFEKKCMLNNIRNQSIDLFKDLIHIISVSSCDQNEKMNSYQLIIDYTDHQFF